MIRAHLATFPPRRRILRRVVDAIVPQVDHLFVVLNEYEDIPGYLAKDAKITAIIPDRDVKDAGKFWFRPEPDDLVFLIDDDIGYPPDYVAATLAKLDGVDLTRNTFGYFGAGLTGMKWTLYPFNKPLDHITGASFLGTGTGFARGNCIPPLEEVEAFATYVDYGWGDWMHQNRILPWVLPRSEQWITEGLPNNLRDSSLFRSVAKKGHPHIHRKLWAFAPHTVHGNQPFDTYRAAAP